MMSCLWDSKILEDFVTVNVIIRKSKFDNLLIEIMDGFIHVETYLLSFFDHASEALPSFCQS